SVTGTVQDSQGHGLGDISVELKQSSGSAPFKTRTNSQGVFCFSKIPVGKYRVLATAASGNQAEVRGIEVSGNGRRQVDLTIMAAKDRKSKAEFFDEPQFTVAGVTDTTSLGGHGSDTIVRTKNGMAKDVVGLSSNSKNAARTASGSKASAGPKQTVGAGSFDDYRRFAKASLARGDETEAIPYLERASNVKPGDPAHELELASALFHTGQYQIAKTRLQSLISDNDTAPVRHLLAEVEEKLNDPVEAVKNYQRAAELTPNEANLFDWGAELLLHHATEPAIQVFGRGSHQFPGSVRMRIALGVAWYAQGSYGEAVKHVCDASDLDPHNPQPYLFLGKMLSVESVQPAAIAEKMERFARLSPEDPWAHYYLALSLWKRDTGQARDTKRIESLLQQSVHLDPK